MTNPFISVVNSLLHEPQASLLNGILFGTKSSMSRDFYNALVVTGTLHIIALSGMNISILISLAAKMTLFLGRRTSVILTVLFIIFFVWFVGFSPSIVRAAMMGSMSLLAIYFGRQYWGLLSLLLTSGIMLLYKSNLITDTSFQLSFLATLGIILAQKRVNRQKFKGLLGQLKYTLIQNFRLTISAQIFTLPIILWKFRRLSLVSPIANILIEWAIQPIMVLGFATSVLGWVWLPLGVVPAFLAWVPLTYLITIVEILARIPGASVQF